MDQENLEQIKTCSNCGRTFPQEKIDLHEAYCCRNFRKCETCGAMIDKNQMEEHHRELHAQKTCEYCDEKYIPSEQQKHMKVCPQRPQHCPYCQNKYPASSIQLHQEGCGSRTKKCTICNKNVTLKEMDGHAVRCAIRRERRQTSQNNREHGQLGEQQLYRQNSSNNMQMNRLQKDAQPKMPLTNYKIKPANIIGPERASKTTILDPIPIGVRLAIQKKSLQKNNSLKNVPGGSPLDSNSNRVPKFGEMEIIKK